MPNLIPPRECARARESVSGRLDDELSELEAARLDDHLRDCDECRAYARDVDAIVAELRAAALEQPTITVFVSARRRPLARLQTAAAAAAIVAVAAGASFAGGRIWGIHGTTRDAFVGVVTADVASLRADSAQQHLLAMLPRLRSARTLRIGRIVAL